MEMATTEIFLSTLCEKNEKMPFFSLVAFISTAQYNTEHFLVNRISELLVRSKMAITLELKLCLSNFSRGIERHKEGYRILL